MGQRATCSRASRSGAGTSAVLMLEVTIEDALDHPEHVGGGEDDAGGGEDGPARVVRRWRTACRR